MRPAVLRGRQAQDSGLPAAGDALHAASWLVQDGVPLYDVQALLGHEDYATTQRYAHLAPDAHSKVLESWARRPDARLTHETRKAHPS